MAFTGAEVLPTGTVRFTLNQDVYLGEAPIIPPLAALANAIYHAVGVRMDQLPMSPGAIWEALKRKQLNRETQEQHHG
jgi:hypothetical protein